MNDPDGVGRAERVGDLRREVDSASHRQRPSIDLVPKCSPLDELGDDERHVSFEVDIVDGDDARMIQCAGGTRFLEEPAAALGIRGHCGGQDLQRDIAVDPRIVSEINLAHSAGAQRRDDFVRTEAVSHNA